MRGLPLMSRIVGVNNLLALNGWLTTACNLMAALSDERNRNAPYLMYGEHEF